MWSDPVCPNDHSGNCGEDQDGGAGVRKPILQPYVGVRRGWNSVGVL